MRSVVVLPQPLEPMMARNSPLRMSRSSVLDGDETAEAFHDAVEDDEGLIGHCAITPAPCAPTCGRGAALHEKDLGEDHQRHRGEEDERADDVDARADLSLQEAEHLDRQGLVQARDEPGDREFVEGHRHGDEQRSEVSQARQKGMMTCRIAIHSDAPRFQAAASRDGIHLRQAQPADRHGERRAHHHMGDDDRIDLARTG